MSGGLKWPNYANNTSFWCVLKIGSGKKEGSERNDKSLRSWIHEKHTGCRSDLLADYTPQPSQFRDKEQRAVGCSINESCLGNKV